MPEFYGKYRGTVKDNKDPLNRSRIQAVVPAISNQALNWALPSTPYAGPKVGLYTIPPIGANVWIEFEAGDPQYPIWSGCFWGLDDKDSPPPDATGPELKVLQTDKMVVILDDKLVKLTVKVPTDAGLMTIVIDKNGIVLTGDKVTATIAPDKIELKDGSATIEMTANSITLKHAADSIAMADTITLKKGSGSVELSQFAIDLKNFNSSVQLSPVSVSINDGALEVT